MGRHSDVWQDYLMNLHHVVSICSKHISESATVLYLSKNPICTTAPDKVKEIVVKNKGDPDSVGCTKQCSDYCQNHWLKARSCSRECNTRKCIDERMTTYGREKCL